MREVQDPAQAVVLDEQPAVQQQVGEAAGEAVVMPDLHIIRPEEQRAVLCEHIVNSAVLKQVQPASSEAQ